jgi:radical SAM protein with 4Fe4S-binding SPASM domain
MMTKRQAYGVTYVRHTIPSSLPAGSKRIVGVIIKNTGEKTWFREDKSGHPVIMAVYLGNQVVTHGFLGRSHVAPSEKDVILFTLKAPLEPGRYLLKIDLVEQNVVFFEDQGCKPLIAWIVVRPAEEGPRNETDFHTRFFMFLYSDLPILAHGALWYGSLALFRAFGWCRSVRKRVIRKWKVLNRNLAFMEQRARKRYLISLPYNIAMDTTTECNMKCLACFRQHQDLDRHSIMGAKVIEKVIRELFPTAESVNVSIIGEPLLSPYLEKIVHALRDFDAGLHVTTNGTLLDRPDLVQRILPVLRYLEISFDSTTPELYERLRTGARFQHVLDNARRVGEIRRRMPDPRFDFGFSVTLFHPNVHELPGLIRLLASIGGNMVRAVFGVLFDERLSYLSILNDPDLYNRVYWEALEVARELGVRLSLPSPFVDREQAGDGKDRACAAIYHSVRIAHDGTMKACQSGETPCVLDYVRKGIRSCWNSEEMRTLRASYDTGNAHPTCRNCYVINLGADTPEKKRLQLLKYLSVP